MDFFLFFVAFPTLWCAFFFCFFGPRWVNVPHVSGCDCADEVRQPIHPWNFSRYFSMSLNQSKTVIPKVP